MAEDMLNLGQKSEPWPYFWWFKMRNIIPKAKLVHGTEDQVVPYLATEATAK